MQALLVVDVQNDFLPGGALAVPRGDEVIQVANRLMSARSVDVVVAAQDWHPPGHESFASAHPGRRPLEVIELHGLQQVLWPDHCVQHTHGASLAAGLDSRRIARVIFKGLYRQVDSYSAFFDNAQRHCTGLEHWLRTRGVRSLVVVGLATDYCVKFSVLDARRLGFEVTVVLDGCRAVNVDPSDADHAVEQMRQAGARIVAHAEAI
jgi:nicotinamidase/pyrazinamidase